MHADRIWLPEIVHGTRFTKYIANSKKGHFSTHPATDQQDFAKKKNKKKTKQNKKTKKKTTSTAPEFNVDLGKANIQDIYGMRKNEVFNCAQPNFLWTKIAMGLTVSFPQFFWWCFSVAEGLDLARSLGGNTRVNVTTQGSHASVIWGFWLKLDAECEVDLTLFPYDRQTCRIQFNTFSYNYAFKFDHPWQQEVTTWLTFFALYIKKTMLRSLIFYKSCLQALPPLPLLFRHPQMMCLFSFGKAKNQRGAKRGIWQL